MRAPSTWDRLPERIYGHWNGAPQASPPSIPRSLRGSDGRGACAIASCQSWSSAPLLLLGFLQYNTLVGIAHAFAFVGLRGTITAYFCRYLADDLLVDTLDHYFGLRRCLHLDALGHPVDYGMRKTERQVQFVALRLSTIANPDE